MSRLPRVPFLKFQEFSSHVWFALNRIRNTASNLRNAGFPQDWQSIVNTYKMILDKNEQLDCPEEGPPKSQQERLQLWAYNLSGFNRYGLMRDDLLLENFDQDVAEAVSRLPDHVIDERNYRLMRASQLSLTHQVLPKKEWTKLENDVQYLKPYVTEVRKEREEREKWDAQE